MVFVRILTGCAVIALLGGCATEPSESDFTKCDFSAQILSTTSLTLDSGQPLLGDPCKSDTTTFEALVISGGGPDGAFGAAFLSTVLAKPDREATQSVAGREIRVVPRPCLITGISTGAIMAPYAYLASSDDPALRATYGPKLHALYQDFDDKNLISGSEIRVLTHDSLHNVQGIKDEIARRLTDDQLVARINDEYARTGRTLIVGATDLYSGNFEVIDLTKYIQHAPTDTKTQMCVGEAIRSSAAIPVEFPPVPIQDGGVNKLYADGGLRHMVFLNSALLNRLNPSARPVTIYGIVNNTYLQQNLLQPGGEGSPVTFKKMSILDVATRSAALAEDQLYLFSAWVTKGALGATAKTGWIDASTGKTCKSAQPGNLFDPTYERCLMQAGDSAAALAGPWRDLQPVATFTNQ